MIFVAIIEGWVLVGVGVLWLLARDDAKFWECAWRRATDACREADARAAEDRSRLNAAVLALKQAQRMLES